MSDQPKQGFYFLKSSVTAANHNGQASRFSTDITAGKLTPAMKEQILAGIPMGRAGTPGDVAGCALFLASDLAAYVTR